MRYTSCQLLGNGCSHYPHPMLQFFGIFVQFYRNALNIMRGNTHIDVYGLLAVRDSLDPSRNYIFHRSRENAQAIDVVILHSFFALYMINYWVHLMNRSPFALVKNTIFLPVCVCYERYICV